MFDDAVAQLQDVVACGVPGGGRGKDDDCVTCDMCRWMCDT
jgi:hypothetical protein